MTIYLDLRSANEARQREWDKDERIMLAYRGNELAGEVGEAIHAVLRGTSDEAAAELADVVICVDLASMAVGGPYHQHAPIRTTAGLHELCSELAMWTGQACNLLKKLEREKLGIRGSRAKPSDLVEAFMGVLRMARALADARAINLESAVRRKFNATSEKVGLRTRIEELAA